ncbi:MAG TPA: hypothetical protein EYG91_02255 [Aquifex aeolicus]|nr:hypothetical protein [Aquifex aeolicus]
MNKEALKILEDPLVIFFVWMALIYLIATVFLAKRFAFWVSSLLTTYIWLKLKMDTFALLQAWGIIFIVIFVVYIGNSLFYIPPFTFFTGKRICSMCNMAIPRRAKVCPYCHCKFNDSNN